MMIICMCEYVDIHMHATNAGNFISIVQTENHEFLFTLSGSAAEVLFASQRFKQCLLGWLGIFFLDFTGCILFRGTSAYCYFHAQIW